MLLDIFQSYAAYKTQQFLKKNLLYVGLNGDILTFEKSFYYIIWVKRFFSLVKNILRVGWKHS